MHSLYKNSTWELVKRPEKWRIVRCKWIYRIKEALTVTEPKMLKAKLIAKGYTQNDGIDFNEVFSHVVRYVSIRVFLPIITVQNLELKQLDVKTTFLHREL